jgi:hypothetical protein
MSIKRRRLATLGGLLAITAAVAVPTAQADSGKALLEIGKLSDGSSAVVNPNTLLPGLTTNGGAGGFFGVDSPDRYTGTKTFTFTPPTDTTITQSKAWNRLYAYGWPAMGTYSTITTSWGNWNVGGAPGSASVNGGFADGAGPNLSGPAATLSGSANQPTSGAGNEQTGYYYLDKLDVELSDAYSPEIDAQPATGELLGTPNASGWYTNASLAMTATASDRGLGVRYLLLKEGTTITKYAPSTLPASCSTKDPVAGTYGGDTYTVRVPCTAASTAYSVNVDLAALGDGSHTLQIGAQDAAGNQRFSAVSYDVKTNAPGANPGPGNPSGLSDPGSTGPGGCSYQDDGSCVLAPSNTIAPSLSSGTPTRGAALTANSGIWSNAGSATFAYQWQRCTTTSPASCADISGATGSSYTPLLADVDGYLRVMVTATNTGATPTQIASPISSKVADSAPAGNVGASSGGGGSAPASSGGGGGGGASKVADTGSAGTSNDSVPTVGPGTQGRGSANGTNGSDTVKLKAVFTSSKSGIVRSTYGARGTINGILVNNTGDPIPGAKLDVTAMRANGARFDDSRVYTNTAGAWSAKLPADVISQSIKVTYRSHENDTVAAAGGAKSLKLRVAARAALTVTPVTKKAKSAKRAHVVVRNGATLVFRVKVAGPVPAGGKTIQLQSTYKGSRKGWTNFGAKVQKTNTKGVFVYRIKTNGTVGNVTYRFRVLVPGVDGGSPAWPFGAGTSGAKSLTIHGAAR